MIEFARPTQLLALESFSCLLEFELMNTLLASPDRLLTCREAADRLRISTRTLFTLTACGELAATRIGRRVLYAPTVIAYYIERQTRGAVA